MNKKIESILKKRAKVIQEKNDLIEPLDKSLQSELNKVFDKDKELQKEINDLLDSDLYQYNNLGDIDQIMSSNAIKKYSDFQDQLNEYLSDTHCIYVNWEHSYLSQSLGPEEIVIADGNVFQSGKVIIDKNQWESSEELKKLIEEHMEKTGFYPSVFGQDRYGNLTLIKNL